MDQTEQNTDSVTKLSECIQQTEPFPTEPGQRWSLCAIQPNHVVEDLLDISSSAADTGRSQEENEQNTSRETHQEEQENWFEQQLKRETYLREVCNSIADSIKLACTRQKVASDATKDKETTAEDSNVVTSVADDKVPNICIVTRTDLLALVEESEETATKTEKKGAKKAAGGKIAKGGGSSNWEELMHTVIDENELCTRLVRTLNKIRSEANHEVAEPTDTKKKGASTAKGGTKGKTESKQKDQPKEENEAHKQAASSILSQVKQQEILPDTIILLLDYPLNFSEVQPLLKGNTLDTKLHCCLEGLVILDANINLPAEEEEGDSPKGKSKQKAKSKGSKDAKQSPGIALLEQSGRDAAKEVAMNKHIVELIQRKQTFMASDITDPEVLAIQYKASLGDITTIETLPTSFTNVASTATNTILVNHVESGEYDQWKESVTVSDLSPPSEATKEKLLDNYSQTLKRLNESSITVSAILFGLREATVSVVDDVEPRKLSTSTPDDDIVVCNVDMEYRKSRLFCGDVMNKDHVDYGQYERVETASSEIYESAMSFFFNRYLKLSKGESQWERSARETERECFAGEGASTTDKRSTIADKARKRLLFADVCRDFERLVHTSDSLHMLRSIKFGYPSVKTLDALEWVERYSDCTYGDSYPCQRISQIAGKSGSSQLLEQVSVVGSAISRLRFEDKREVHRWTFSDWCHWRLMSRLQCCKRILGLLTLSYKPLLHWGIDEGHSEALAAIHRPFPRSRHEVEFFDFAQDVSNSVWLSFGHFKAQKRLSETRRTCLTSLNLSPLLAGKTAALSTPIRNCTRTDWLFPCDNTVVKIDHNGVDTREDKWKFGALGRRLTVVGRGVTFGCTLAGSSEYIPIPSLGATKTMLTVCPAGFPSCKGQFFADFTGVGENPVHGGLPSARLNVQCRSAHLPPEWYLTKPGRRRLKRWLRKNSLVDTSSSTWLEDFVKNGDLLSAEADIKTLKHDGFGHACCRYVMENNLCTVIDTDGTISCTQQDDSLRTTPQWPKGFVERQRKLCPHDGTVVRYLEDGNVHAKQLLLPNSSSILYIPIEYINAFEGLFQICGVDIKSLEWEANIPSDAFVALTHEMGEHLTLRLKYCSKQSLEKSIHTSREITETDEGVFVVTVPSSTVAMSRDAESASIVRVRYELLPVSDMPVPDESEGKGPSEVHPRYNKAKTFLVLQHLREHLKLEHQAELKRISGQLWKRSEDAPHVYGDTINYSSEWFHRVVYVTFEDGSTLAIFPDETCIFRLAVRKSAKEPELKQSKSQHTLFQRALFAQPGQPTVEVDLPYEQSCVNHIQGHEFTSSFATMRTRFVTTLPDGTIISCDHDPSFTTNVNGRLRVHRQNGDIVCAYDDGYVEYRPGSMEDPAEGLESGVASLFHGRGRERRKQLTENESKDMEPIQEAGIYKFMLPNGEFKMTDSDNNIFYLRNDGQVLTDIAGALETTGAEDDLRVIFPRIESPLKPYLFWFDHAGNAAEFLSPSQWNTLLEVSGDPETDGDGHAFLGTMSPSVSSGLENGPIEEEHGANDLPRFPMKNRYIAVCDCSNDGGNLTEDGNFEESSAWLTYHTFLTPLLAGSTFLEDEHVGVIKKAGNQYLSRCNFGWIEFSDRHIQSLIQRARLSRKEIFGQNARPAPSWIDARSDATALAQLRKMGLPSAGSGDKTNLFSSVIRKFPKIISVANFDDQAKSPPWSLQQILCVPEFGRSQRQALELDEQAVSAWREQTENSKAQFESSDDRTSDQIEQESREGMYLKYLRLAATHQKKVVDAKASRMSSRSSGRRSGLKSLKSSVSPSSDVKEANAEDLTMPSTEHSSASVSNSEFQEASRELLPQLEQGSPKLGKSYADPSYWAQKMDSTQREKIRRELREQYQVPSANTQELIYARAVEAAARQVSLLDMSSREEKSEDNRSANIEYSVSSDSDDEDRQTRNRPDKSDQSTSPNYSPNEQTSPKESLDLIEGDIEKNHPEAQDSGGEGNEISKDLYDAKSPVAHFDGKNEEEEKCAAPEETRSSGSRPPPHSFRPGSVRSSGSREELSQPLQVQPRIVRFDEQPVGASVERQILVRNVLNKPLRIRVDRRHLHLDRTQTSFKVAMEGGSYIPPGMSHHLTIQLQAVTLGQFKDSLEIQCSVENEYVCKRAIRISAIVVPAAAEEMEH